MDTDILPRRARRQFFNRRTAALGALVTCAIGFYAGIRVEKTELSSSGSTLGGGGGARLAALAARSGAGGAGAGGFAGPGAGGANAAFGTVAGVKGKTILLTDTSGNTVKVKVTSSTKITKNQPVSRHAIRPGDTVIVTGGSGSGQTTTAASITDSGNRGGGSSSSSSGSGGSSSPGSGGGGNSAVGSLFSSGG